MTITRCVAVVLCVGCLLLYTACGGASEDTVSERASNTETVSSSVTETVSECETWHVSENPLARILVNQQVLLRADDVPNDLVTLDTSDTLYGKNVSVRSTVAEAVANLLDAMRADGITDCYVTSGYRSYAYQEQLFTRYLNEERDAHPEETEAQIRARVLAYSAAPGTSEHQTGLAVDLMTTAMGGLYNYASEYGGAVGFAETRAFAWLTLHAAEYGFILRYPEGQTDVTGYAYESWHYRYVGVEAATFIRDRAMTLEEYLQ